MKIPVYKNNQLQTISLKELIDALGFHEEPSCNHREELTRLKLKLDDTYKNSHYAIALSNKLWWKLKDLDEILQGALIDISLINTLETTVKGIVPVDLLSEGTLALIAQTLANTLDMLSNLSPFMVISIEMGDCDDKLLSAVLVTLHIEKTKTKTLYLGQAQTPFGPLAITLNPDGKTIISDGTHNYDAHGEIS